MHHAGRNGEHSCVPFNLSNTSCGFILKEVDWGGKYPINSVVDWQRHETYPTGHNIAEVDWGALHDSSFFLFLVNIDFDAKPKDFFTQELWGGLPERTSSTTHRSLNHVEGKLVHLLELQKGPICLDHQLDQQRDTMSSPCPQQITQSHHNFDKKTNSVQILHLWYIKVQTCLSKIDSYWPKREIG